MTIAANLADIRARIDHACDAAGRARGSVRLVAVSKYHPLDAIREAVAAGQLDFGENYAQSLRDRADAIGPGPRWHFIGALQRNKVKYVVGRACLVHDVDSLALAEEIGRRSGSSPTRVLIGVNVGDEGQKSGVPPGEALALARAVAAVPGVDLAGLMCIPPWVDDADEAAPFFATMRDLAEAGRAEGLPLHELSMGMSHDFVVAIAHGATIVRVGTAIFGERPG